MPRNSGSRTTRDSIHLCCGLVQAGSWVSLCKRHDIQKCVGLWILQIYHSMDHEVRLCATYNDQHESDNLMVSLWRGVLVWWQEDEDMDEEQLCSSIVISRLQCSFTINAISESVPHRQSFIEH